MTDTEESRDALMRIFIRESMGLGLMSDDIDILGRYLPSIDLDSEPGNARTGALGGRLGEVSNSSSLSHGNSRFWIFSRWIVLIFQTRVKLSLGLRKRIKLNRSG
jgi:hypothetical protein